MAVSPAQAFDASFDALLRAPAEPQGTGTAVPGSTEEFNMTPPPRRAEEVNEHFEKRFAEFEKRILEIIAAAIRPMPAPGFATPVSDPWAQARAAASAPQAPTSEA